MPGSDESSYRTQCHFCQYNGTSGKGRFY
ncbi:hypothetical protein [Fischerella sp.]